MFLVYTTRSEQPISRRHVCSSGGPGRIVLVLFFMNTPRGCLRFETICRGSKSEVLLVVLVLMASEGESERER